MVKKPTKPKAAKAAGPDLSHIIPELQPFAVPVDSLNFDPDNARKHSRENIEAIKRSLEEFGQRQPLVVQREGRIVRAGNGRLQAAREMGWQYVACVVTDDADTAAKAFGIADNRTAELAAWDGPQLFETLRELEQEAPALLAALSFTDSEMERLRTRYAAPPEPGRQDPPNGEGEKPQKVGTKTITLNYAKPDHDRAKEAIEYLKDTYGTTSIEDTVLQCLIQAADADRQDLLDSME